MWGPILALDLYWSLVDSYSIQESESVLSKKEEEKHNKIHYLQLNEPWHYLPSAVNGTYWTEWDLEYLRLSK